MAYKNQTGFTILELMIAMTVFTIAVLLVTTGVIQIGREYKLGATKAKLNTFARELHAQFTQEIQYSGNKPVNLVVDPTSPVKTAGFDEVVCMGKTRYLIKYLVQSDPYGDRTLAYDTINDIDKCGTQALNTDIVYPLPKDARLTLFTITVPQPGVSLSYRLDTRIVIGQQDMFEPSPPAYPDGDFEESCRSGTGFGSAFCSVIILSSDIARKVNN